MGRSIIGTKNIGFWAGGSTVKRRGGSRHVGEPILDSNLTRRVDYALFMVEALANDELIHEAPAIVGCRTPLVLAHGSTPSAP